VIVSLAHRSKDLSIRDAGGTDVASLLFEGKGFHRRARDLSNRALVGFRLVSKPECFNISVKDTASTNSAGEVNVLLTAGSAAGIAQVMAFAAGRKANIRWFTTLCARLLSQSPFMVAHRTSAHFSIASDKYNLAGE